MFNTENTEFLDYSNNGQRLCILPWGHGLRVHDSFFDKMNNWALEEKVKPDDNFVVKYYEDHAEIINGKTKATVNQNGKITFYKNDGTKILEEYWRQRLFKKVTINDHQFINKKQNEYSNALKETAREFIANPNGNYTIHTRFEANDNERIYGMGQYQQKQLNLKGCKLELAQRNSQASVPFYLSSKGYGFLWNNPGIGEVSFANNLTEWISIDSDFIDYWICVEDTPKQIISSYTDVTGHAPQMPKFALGLWQSKLRYRTQDEVLNVARKYHSLGIPLSVIVIDYFHWPYQGDYKFDSKYFPDPVKMVNELDQMGIKLMVSVWPNIDHQSENFSEMKAKGYLVRADRGNGITMTFQGNTTFFDATNPEARKFLWSKIKQNYYQKGIHLFWLDEAEPEYSPYNFDNYRLFLGRNTQVGNIYPKLYAKGFYDGEKAANQEEIVSLVRSAWAGSQKYGSLVWSGDIDSSFRSFRYQYQIGLNIGMAGIPWWTCDIGGFHGGSKDDPDFKELLIRWFEFSTFSPIMRMHGNREPHEKPVSTVGGGKEGSGAGNEIWSFGEDVYKILKKYVDLRERLKPYLDKCMTEAHTKGYPVMRSLFFNFPNDKNAWHINDEHMLGDKYLIAPIFCKGARARKVYLPAGARWKNINTGAVRSGGILISCNAPIDQIPVFKRIK
jgi:alpha-D-xyloside xylohydrolase